MSSDFSFLFIPHSSPLLHSFELFLCFLLFMAVFGFWLTPGGLAWSLSRAKTQTRSIIPGPSGLPILGSLLAFTNSLTHRILFTLSQTYDASTLMAFSVGFTRFIISSNAETAKEILNSSAFADRPVKESAYQLLFHRAMGFAPYGEYWRNLRRISATHLFSPRRISCFGELRQEIGFRMVEEIMKKMETDGEVEVKNVLHFGSLNNMMMNVFGKGYDPKDGDGIELEGLLKEGYELLGMFNWSDHFPVLGWLDLQGVRRRSKELVSRVNIFVGKIVEEHRMKREVLDHQDSENHSFVDVLLHLEKENRLCDSDIIAVLWEMIFRGTDSVAVLLEWILARMVLHPDIQMKAQHEIDTLMMQTNATQVTNSHLINLPYLQAIVKETLRLHPPGPLLSWARLAIHDTCVGPYFVPAGTTAMVNMWAITHDDKVWRDPWEFRPERFIEEDDIGGMNIMGSDLRLAPFGSGRRVCPGKAMGVASVQLWLAQLLSNFWWSGGSDCGVELAECLKLSMEMKHPLVCKPIPRRL